MKMLRALILLDWLPLHVVPQVSTWKLWLTKDGQQSVSKRHKIQQSQVSYRWSLPGDTTDFIWARSKFVKSKRRHLCLKSIILKQSPRLKAFSSQRFVVLTQVLDCMRIRPNALSLLPVVLQLRRNSRHCCRIRHSDTISWARGYILHKMLTTIR